MPITGQLIVLGLVVTLLGGLILVLTAFNRKPHDPLVPPVDPPAARSRSGGRIALGIVLMVLGGVGLLFVYAISGLAQLASH